MIELRAHCSNRAGRSISFLHLPKDLRFAHYHGVEAGGNPEDVANSFIFAKFIKVTFKWKEIGFEILAQKFAQIAGAIFHVGDKFDPIAG